METNFTFSPRVLAHLGEDLIKNESIALLELVKNAYDACASQCAVSFKSQNGIVESIEITDDGFGMDKQLIESVWLVVGTSNKLNNTSLNKCGRAPLGEKGIGRLGVHKLGNEITLISKTKTSNEVVVKIDWNNLSKSNKIEDFKVIIEENEMPKYFKNSTGTKISISDLKSNWDRRSLREVYRNLLSLNSPFSEKNDSFAVSVNNNEGLFVGLPAFSEIIDSALYFGHVVMTGNRIVDLSYKFKPWSTITKLNEGRVKNTKEFAEHELHIVDDAGNEIDLETHQIGTIEFDIAIFELESQIFNLINAEKKSVKDYLKENGGIKVYRDNVRVYNYGEKDNDWLGLDLRRVKRFAGNVSNNLIIGSVKLNRRESNGLREKSNREGFIEGESYFAFLSAVDFALSVIVKERTIDKHVLTSLYKKQKALEPVLSDLNELAQFVEDKIKNKEDKDEILKYITRINNQYTEVKEVLIKSANAGLNLSVVIHEIDKLIHELSGCITRKDTQRAIQISLSLEKIVTGYSAMLKKSSIQNSEVSKIAKIAIDNYEFRFIDHKISIISNWKETQIKGFLAESESISVLTNLLDNAIYWLSFTRVKDATISVYITDEIRIDGQDYSSIVVSDNGPGFSIPFDIATKPFITGKPHNIGSGLGLHIATEMMKAMNGQLMLLDKDDILLPKQVKNASATQAIIAMCFPKTKK